MSVRLDTDNWYRLEGYILPASDYDYSGDITPLDGLDIWYTNVEVRLQNPDTINYIHGVNYKTQTFRHYGTETIEQIAASYTAVLGKALSDMARNEGALTYMEPFVVTESTIICFGDAYGSTLDRYVVILKDSRATADMTGITAEYTGPSVAMDEEFNEEDLTVTGIFNDGHESEIMPSAYQVFRRDDNTETRIVNKTGIVHFYVKAVYGDNEWTAPFTVQGVKRLTGITARYDGPDVAVGHKASKKDFVVSAQYSDGSASTVDDWSFYNGNMVTAVNGGILTVYYMGFTTDVTVKTYYITVKQLKAFYNGPDIEKGKQFSLDDLTVKIYSQSTDGLHGFWEELERGSYTVSTRNISREGDNVIGVTYLHKTGALFKTSFIVKGFIAKADIGWLTAEYTGPPVPEGQYFNTNLLDVKAHWTDGKVTDLKAFTVNSTKILKPGDNEFKVTYRKLECIVIVPGLEAESTTMSGYKETEVPLSYPEASMSRMRYRGPSESIKLDETNKDLVENIGRLYDMYKSLKEEYNAIKDDETSIFNTSSKVLNACAVLRHEQGIMRSMGRGCRLGSCHSCTEHSVH